MAMPAERPQGMPIGGHDARHGCLECPFVREHEGSGGIDRNPDHADIGHRQRPGSGL